MEIGDNDEIFLILLLSKFLNRGLLAVFEVLFKQFFKLHK